MTTDHQGDSLMTTPKIGLLAQEEPPTGRGRGAGVFDSIVALVPELRAHRGDWFCIAEFPGATSASGHAKKLREKYPDQIQAKGVRDKQNGGSKLYARWTGNRGGVA